MHKFDGYEILNQAHFPEVALSAVMIKSDNKIYQDMVKMMGIPGSMAGTRLPAFAALDSAFGHEGQDDQGNVSYC